MKVGIIGAGTMGAGIAQAFAETEGYEVYLCDINNEFAANGKARIEKGLSKLVAKGKVTQEYADGIVNKITTGTKDICKYVDLVIEAALEVCPLNSRPSKSYRISFLQPVFLQPIPLPFPSPKSVQVWTDP